LINVSSCFHHWLGYLNIELRHDLLDGQAEQAEVYFDDFEVTHTYSNVVVAYDYYPYGLPMENRQLEREQTRHNYQPGRPQANTPKKTKKPATLLSSCASMMPASAAG
jgi:hypothetical protein